MAIRVFRELKRFLPLSRQASLIAFLVPRRFWFRCALVASRWQGGLVTAMGGNGALTELLMREHWLHELTKHNAFSIPWRLHGYELLDEYLRKGPVMFYSTHLAMSDMPLRVFIEKGNRPPVPVASPGRISDKDRYRVPGFGKTIPALPPAGYVLARMRTLLRRGDSIACLAERELFAVELSSNPMRLAGRMGVPVFFALGELAPDGVVDVTFQPAPHPYCESEDAVAENLSVLRGFNDRILRSVGVVVPNADGSLQPTRADLPAQLAASAVGAGSRLA